MTYSVKPMLSSEFASAYELAWESFSSSCKKIFPPEGAESFHDFLYGGKIEEKYAVGKFVMFGCYSEGELIGVGGMRDGSHIALMFTAEKFRRMGVGRIIMKKLIAEALKTGQKKITLNSSPTGINFYKAMGFVETDIEQISEGIIYTPMELVLR